MHSSAAFSESEIAARLNVSQPTLSRDVKALNRESQDVIKTLVKEYYPLEFRNIINSIKMVLKKSWEIINDSTGKYSNKDSLNALKLVIDASQTNLEILLKGPVNLFAEHLQEKLDKIIEEQESPKNFMPPLLHQNLEDLK